VVVCARINLFEPEPLRNIMLILKKYNSVRKLSEEERLVLFPMIKARLALLLLMTCSLVEKDKENAYTRKCKDSMAHYLTVFVGAVSNEGFRLKLDEVLNDH
jgi:Ser/Thr protein kinase RdoA (MazF antagonist)